MWEMMRSYLKDNDISIKNGTDVNSVMRDIMYVLLDVKSWTSAGKIKSSRIDVDTIIARIGEAEMVTINNLFAMQTFDANLARVNALQLGQGGRSTQLNPSNTWRTITIGETSYTVLCQN